MLWFVDCFVLQILRSLLVFLHVSNCANKESRQIMFIVFFFFGVEFQLRVENTLVFHHWMARKITGS